MQCAICEGPAELVQTNTADAKAVHCGKCGDYLISGMAEEILSRKDPYARTQALRYAQTNAWPGRRPYVRGVV